MPCGTTVGLLEGQWIAEAEALYSTYHGVDLPPLPGLGYIIMGENPGRHADRVQRPENPFPGKLERLVGPFGRGSVVRGRIRTLGPLLKVTSYPKSILT